MGFPRQEYWSELPFLLSGGQGIAKHLTMSRIAPVQKSITQPPMSIAWKLRNFTIEERLGYLSNHMPDPFPPRPLYSIGGWLFIYSTRTKWPTPCWFLQTCSSRASLLAQAVKNLIAVLENEVQSLGCEDPLEKEMGYNPLQYSCLGNHMDRGAWWATVHGVARVGHGLATKQPPH